MKKKKRVIVHGRVSSFRNVHFEWNEAIMVMAELSRFPLVVMTFNCLLMGCFAVCAVHVSYRMNVDSMLRKVTKTIDAAAFEFQIECHIIIKLIISQYFAN